MSNPFRGESKATQAAKAAAMGVKTTFLPDLATRISGAPNQETTSGEVPSQNENQFPEDKHGPGYGGIVPQSWVTGAGENATTKPGFKK